MVGRGEVIPDRDGDSHTQWSLDWTALSVVLAVRHPLTQSDDPADLLDGLLVVRAALNTPTQEYILTRGIEDVDG